MSQEVVGVFLLAMACNLGYFYYIAHSLTSKREN